MAESQEYFQNRWVENSPKLVVLCRCFLVESRRFKIPAKKQHHYGFANLKVTTPQNRADLPNFVINHRYHVGVTNFVVAIKCFDNFQYDVIYYEYNTEVR